jgi:hypothetical protein
LWTQLLEATGRVSPFTRTYLLEAHPVSFNKNLFTIGFPPEFEEHLGLVDNARNHTLLQTKLAELGHHKAQIKFVKAERPAGQEHPSAPASVTPPAPKRAAPAPGNGAAPAPAATKARPTTVPGDKEDFKNDPLIQKALEIFKGQIVDVRV